MVRRADAPAGRAPIAEAGYNLVVLVMAIAILNIVVAAMLPLWSTQIRREKEEELIFRGLQYAEAIRLFQTRFQRFPTTLKELVEVQPRCIRQLWKDPMTEDGKWAPIYLGQGTPLIPSFVPPNGRAPIRRGAGAPPSEANGTGLPNGGGPAGGEQPETVANGPIVGVHSRSTGKSIEIWNGQQEYDQWVFTYNLLTIRTNQPGARPGGAGARPPLSVRWIGRPFPGLPQLPGLPVGMPVPGAPGVGRPGGVAFPGPGLPGGLPVGGAPAPPPRPIR
jgi:type II secretory pathway pseudopilin PulG